MPAAVAAVREGVSRLGLIDPDPVELIEPSSSGDLWGLRHRDAEGDGGCAVASRDRRPGHKLRLIIANSILRMRSR